MKKLLFVIIAFSVWNRGMLNAQFVADTTLNTTVHDLSGSAQSTPLTSTTETGRTFVSWFDNSSGQYVLRMQLLDSLGQKLWPDTGLLVSNFPQGSALFRYDLTCDHQGNAVVAFQDERSGSQQVVVQKVNQLGQLVWGNAGVLLTDSSSTGLAPVLSVLGNNDILVAWSASGSGSRWVPFRRLASETGAIVWSSRISAEGQRFSRPSMVASGSNHFILLYVKEAGGFPPLSTMYAQKLSGDNAQAEWAQPVQVSGKNIPFFFFPQIHTNTKKGFFLVFNTGNPVNPMLNDVYAQHVDSAGNSWTDDGIQLSLASDGNKYNGGYCWNPADSSLCVAIRMQDANQTVSGISLQKINQAGERLLGENGLEIRTLTTDLLTPWLLLNSGDGLVCIYGSGSFGNQKIKGLKVDYNGQPLWTYDPVACASASNKDDLSAGPFRNGQTVLVWSEDRSGDDGIYAQNLRLSGQFGTGELTGIQPIEKAAIRVFPNPGRKQVLEISSGEPAELKLRILDLGGRILSEKSCRAEAGKSQFSIGENLSSGFYLLEVGQQHETRRFRMVIE